MWAIIVPPLETPDEIHHLAYIKFVAAEGRLPVQTQEAMGGVLDHEAHQPPLYYLLSAAIYKGSTALGIRPTPLQQWLDRVNPHFIGRYQGLDAQETFFVQQGTFFNPDPDYSYDLVVLRAFSVLLASLGVIAIYATASLVWPGRHWPALLTTSTIAFVPQISFMTASINNDALAFAVGAVCLLSFVTMLQIGSRQITPHRPAGYLWLGAVLGLGILSKLTLAALIPAGALLPLIGPKRTPRALFLAWVWMALGFLAVSGWWFARNWFLYGDLLGDHWKVNPAAFQWDLDPKSLFSDYFRLQNFWHWTARSFVGRFGFMHIDMPGFFYPLYLALFILGAGGALLALWQSRSSWPDLRLRLFLLIVFGLAVAQLVYLNLRVSQPQGRYLFPVAGALAMLLGDGLLVLGRTVQGSARWQGTALAAWFYVLLVVAANLYTLHHLYQIYAIP